VSGNSYKRIAIGSAVVIALIVIVGLLTGANSKNDASADATDGLAQDIPAAQAALSVHPEDVPVEFCNELVRKYDGKFVTLDDGTETPYFVLGSTEPVGERKWSDAVNVPLKPQTLEAEQATLCQDPAQAAMVMNGMQKVNIGSKSVADLNADWMKAQGSPSAVDQWAEACSKEDVSKHLACAKTMATTAYLLEQFHNDDVVKASTEWNFHLTGPSAGGVPEFGMNPKQEHNAYFVGLSYTTKTGGVCVRIGFNVGVTSPNGGDQRFAGLECKTPPSGEKTPPDKGGPPSNPPGTTPPTNPPTNPPTTPPTNPPTKCPCVDPTDVIQDVPSPHPGDPNVPPHEPSAQPTTPYDPSNPANPTPGGHNGGGPSQPGTSAPPDTTPEEPTGGPPMTGGPTTGF